MTHIIQKDVANGVYYENFSDSHLTFSSSGSLSSLYNDVMTQNDVNSDVNFDVNFEANGFTEQDMEEMREAQVSLYFCDFIFVI